MIKLIDVSKYYKSSGNVALGLHKVNLEFEMGDFVVITGESGSGKSTLLNVISGSDTYEDGEMYFHGKETSYYDDADWENYRKEKIGFVYQSYNLIDSFTVIGNIKTAIYIRNPLMEEKEAEQKAMEYLDKVGLKDQAKKKSTHLSSGQKQRLSIARALAKETDIIVADEPTGNLDVENSIQIVEILQALSKEKLVIMVTHNYDEVEKYATRKIRMFNGEVGEDIRLKEKNVVEKQSEQKELKKIDKKTDHVLAKKLIRKVRNAKPHMTVIVTTIFLFIFFAVFVFYGSFEKNLDFSIAKDYSNQTYANSNTARISVRNSNGSMLTQTDVETIQKISHIEYVELYDLVNDITYMNEEGVDYEYDFRSSTGSTSSLPDMKSIRILDDSKYARTVTGISESDIKKGTMPVEFNEILVASKDKDLIGSTMKVYFTRKNNWSNGYVYMAFKVTGITDVGEKGQIYLSDKLGEMFNVTANKLSGYTFYGLYTGKGRGLAGGTAGTYAESLSLTDLLKMSKETANTPILLINEELTGNQLKLSEDFYANAFITQDKTIIQQLVCEDGFFVYGPEYDQQKELANIQGGQTEHSQSVIEVSRDFFNRVYTDKNSYQITVYMTDYAYTDRVIKSIEKAGYEAVSVYRAGSTDYNIDKVNENTSMLFISLFALLMVFFVGTFLIKLMISMRDRDYNIMLLMGLNRSSIDRMNEIDILINGTIAAVGTIILVNIALAVNLPYVASAVMYYDGLDYIIYLLIMCFMMLYLRKRIRRVKKKSKRDI